MLRKYTNGAIHRWDDFVHAALWACRIRIHSTTGYSPFYLTYGREPRIPGDISVPYISKDNLKDPRTIADMTSRELADLGQHRAAAEFRMKAMAEKDKERWDSNIKKKTYEVGDLVMLTHEGRFGLEPRFKGPFVIVQVFPDFGTVKLQTVAGEPLKSLVHFDRLLAAKGDAPTEPWYDPTAARRNMRDTMNDINNDMPAETPYVNTDNSTPEVTLPNYDADPIDPLESTDDYAPMINNDSSPIMSPPIIASPSMNSPITSVHSSSNISMYSASHSPIVPMAMDPPVVTPISVPGRTPVLEGGNVDVPEVVNPNKEPLFSHVPPRENKRKFKPKVPSKKRSKRKITQD